MFERSARLEFGLWLRKERQSRGLKRSALVRALGYQNLNKGCRRLEKWERGDAIPSVVQLEILSATMGIPRDEWEAKFHRLKASRIYHETDTHIAEETMSLMARFHHTLLAYVPGIEAIGPLSHIQLQGLRIGVMHFGSTRHITLGKLISAWRRGWMGGEADGRRFLVLSGWCSPLSGRTQFSGFFHGQALVESRDDASTIYAITKSKLSWNRRTAPETHWSLDQLLACLNIDMPPATIWCGDETRGAYDFNRATLTWDGEKVPFNFDLSSLRAAASQRRDSGATPPATRASVSDSGADQHHRRQWVMRPGCAQDPSGVPRIRWDRDLPPLVRRWCIDQLDRKIADGHREDRD